MVQAVVVVMLQTFVFAALLVHAVSALQRAWTW
jgi:hypothetical protein